MNHQEIEKCKNDIVYFVENYVKIKTWKNPPMTMKLLPFQKDVLRKLETNKFNIFLQARQTYMTTNISMFITKYVRFNENKTIMLFIMKHVQGSEILVKISGMLDALQVNYANNGSFLYTETNCKIIIMYPENYNPDDVKADVVLWNDIAYFKNLKQVFKDLYPKLTAHDTSVILTSSPNKKNYFKDLWEGALKGKNAFVPTRIDYSVVPNRDDEWMKNEKSNIGENAFKSQYELSFEH